LSARAPQTPDGLEQRLLARTRAVGFAAGDLLIVGFSGGRDSLALAAALRRVASTLGLEIRLVHIDHRLRPCSGDDDRALDAMAAVAMQGAIGVDGSLQGDGLRGQPLAVQRRMVRGWLLARTGLPMISADRTEAVLDLAEQDRGGRTIEIGEGWRATCRRGMLRLERTEREARRGA
jgi:tRNA(Ile)-lysidine synthase